MTCDERFKAWLNSETIIDVDENKDPTKHKSTEVQKKLNNLESKVRVLEANEKVILKSAKEKEDNELTEKITMIFMVIFRSNPFRLT